MKKFRVRAKEEIVVDYWYEAEDRLGALKKHDNAEEMLCEPDEGDPTETEIISIEEVKQDDQNN